MRSVSDEIINILDRSTLAGSNLVLPEQIEREDYVQIDKVLRMAGGKWNRKLRAHVFAGAAADAIEPIILTGEVRDTKSDFGQFFTPPELAEYLAAMACILPGMRVLEPEAGIGNLVRAARAYTQDVTAWEIDIKLYETLVMDCEIAYHGDFLQVTPEQIAQVDRVLMNPPFAKQADIDHVVHALKFLKPGGRLVSVMGAGIRFRQTKKAHALRLWVEKAGGTITDLPAGSFKASGTDVNAVVVNVVKPVNQG